jgi:hypothetical protein
MENGLTGGREEFGEVTAPHRSERNEVVSNAECEVAPPRDRQPNNLVPAERFELSNTCFYDRLLFQFA